MSKDLTAARLIAAARLAKTPLAPLPENCRPMTPDEGYSVQEVLHGLLRDDNNERRVGYKIGCTTPVMQQMIGVDHPCAGSISDTEVFHDHVSLPYADFINVGVECEICVILARDLSPDNAPYSRERVVDAISAVAPSIEIIDRRAQGGPAAVGIPTMIADDFSAAGAVLGPETRDWKNIDLAALSGRVLIDGKELSAGVGADVMGHPLEAVAWFANMKAARGEILQKGEFILTGSLTMAQFPEGPCEVTVEIDQLGSVGVTFT
jgi:2-keto-4-pentenoate hydratase